MLTQGDDVEAHALHRRGWSISAIARHLERDRKTVRAYVAGQRSPGVRRSAVPDPLKPFAPYLAARFADDPHLTADRPLRRGRPARLSAQLSELRPGRPRRGPAAPLRAVPGGQRSGDDRDRAPAGRGDLRGTGSSAAMRPGAGPRTSSWAPCPTRAGSGASSPRRSTRPTSSRRWTPSCGAWAGRPATGGPIGWPRSSCRARPTSSHRSPPLPSTTA